MPNPPFSVTPEAVKWIAMDLDNARTHPELNGMLPVLCYSSGYTKRNIEAQVFEAYEGYHFLIGWYPVDSVMAGGFIEFDLLDHKIHVPPDVVQLLQHQQLVVERVHVGYPDPSATERTLLRAKLATE